MSARANSHCHTLGVCQSRKPACSGCAWKPLAPGTVAGPYARQRRWPVLRGWLDRMALALLAVAVLAALSLTVGLLLGYLGSVK